MQEKETKKPIVFSLISSKGGVGKTTLAINISYELGLNPKSSSVLLVDCDIYNRGATLWLMKDKYSDSNNPLSLTELMKKYNMNKNVKICKEVLSLDVLYDNKKVHSFRFLPSILEDSVSTLSDSSSNLHDVLKSPNTSKNFMEAFLKQAVQKWKPDFIILDCHPGPVNLTIACCQISDCTIIVSDFDTDTLISSILLAWRIEQDQHDSYQYRVVINRLPSEDLIGEGTTMMREAVNKANGIWPQLNKGDTTVSENFDKVLVEIPDLEEMRIEDIEKATCLSPRRRGGNAMILSVKAMLRGLGQQGLLGANFSLFYFSKDNEELELAFNNLAKFYHPIRGLGKTGLSSKMFFFHVGYQSLFAIYLVTRTFTPEDWNGIKLGSTLRISWLVSCTCCFLGVLIHTWKLVRGSRKQFEIFQLINGYSDSDSKWVKQYSIYSQGSNPNITTAVWWPRFTWFVASFPPFLLALIDNARFLGDLPSNIKLIIPAGCFLIVCRQAYIFFRNKTCPGLIKDALHFARCCRSVIWTDRKQYKTTISDKKD